MRSVTTVFPHTHTFMFKNYETNGNRFPQNYADYLTLVKNR